MRALAEGPGHRLRHVLVAAGEDGRERLEHRHPGAQVAEQRGKLAPDGPAPHHGHGGRELLEGQELIRGHHQLAVDVEPRNGPGYRPGGQDDVRPDDLGGGSVVAGHLDPVVGEEPAAPVEHRDPAALQEALEPLEQLVDHLLLPGLADREAHGGNVLAGTTGMDPELVRPGHRAEDRRRLQELLGRHAAPVQTGAADLVELDHSHRETGGGTVQGGGIAAGPATDDDHVERGRPTVARGLLRGCRLTRCRPFLFHIGCRGNHLR